MKTHPILCAPLCHLTLCGSTRPGIEPMTHTPASDAPVPAALLTVAERSDWTATATYEQVLALCAELDRRSDLVSLSFMGTSHEGRRIPLLLVGDRPYATAEQARRSGKIVALLFANIHAGEVCGKEAFPMLVRELALDPRSERSRAILDKVMLLVVPIYNADGNERVSPTNRPGQVGPSPHGAARERAGPRPQPRLHEGPRARDARDALASHQVGPGHHFRLAHHERLVRPLHPDVRGAAEPRVAPRPDAVRARHDAARGGEARARARGLRHVFLRQLRRRPRRVAGVRRAATLRRELPRAPRPHVDTPRGVFVRVVQGTGSSRRSEFTRRPLYAAERRRHPLHEPARPARPSRRGARLRRGGHRADPVRWRPSTVRSRSRPSRPVEDRATFRRARRRSGSAAEVPDLRAAGRRGALRGRYEPTLSVVRPLEYAIPGHDAVIDNLRAHGIVVEQQRVPRVVTAEVYRIDSITRADREYQGVRAVTVEATPRRTATPIGEGWHIVRTAQPLGILAVYLLEPQSDDGLTHWRFFGDSLREGSDFPVLRVVN